jgi:hypothetical protein
MGKVQAELAAYLLHEMEILKICMLLIYMQFFILPVFDCIK